MFISIFFSFHFFLFPSIRVNRDSNFISTSNCVFVLSFWLCLWSTWCDSLKEMVINIMFNLQIPYRYGFSLPSSSSSHRCMNAKYKKKNVQCEINDWCKTALTQAHSKFGYITDFHNSASLSQCFFVSFCNAISISFTQQMKVKFSEWSVSAYNVFCSSYLNVYIG